MAKAPNRYHWTRQAVAIDYKPGGWNVDRQAGVQASFFVIPADWYPRGFVRPADVEAVGLKVYRSNGFKRTRDAAVKAQVKLSRHALAPILFGCWRVKACKPDAPGFPAACVDYGWGFLTECIDVAKFGWTGDAWGWTQGAAEEYLDERLPGFGDMHHGNYGFNRRLGVPQVLDMGDHGIGVLGWTRVPPMSGRALALVCQARERLANMADAAVKAKAAARAARARHRN